MISGLPLVLYRSMNAIASSTVAGVPSIRNLNSRTSSLKIDIGFSASIEGLQVLVEISDEPGFGSFASRNPTAAKTRTIKPSAYFQRMSDLLSLDFESVLV